MCHTCSMKFICNVDGKLFENIYLDRDRDDYVCWKHLVVTDKRWFRGLDKLLAQDKDRERRRKLPPQDLVMV